VNLHDSTGKLIVLDTYIGRNMAGVQRGEIKKFLILETLPKPLNYTGGMSPLSYGGTFTINRVLGTVPVESDGSAYMELPANRSLFFVALDENDFSVKRMQSFLAVMPGELTTCIGCHEDRTMAVPNMPVVQALQKPVNRPQPIPGAPEVFDYPRDIQPIWDRHCLGCHDVDRRDGGVLLNGDNGPQYSLSYFELQKRLQMSQGQNQIRGNLPPRTIGSSASPLMDKINVSHYNVTLDAQEMRLVKLWIDASAHFIGTYAGLGSGMIGRYVENNLDRSDAGWPSMQAAADAQNRRCGGCHSGNMKLPSSPSDNLGLNTWEVGYNGGSGYLSPMPWLVGNTNGTYSGWRAVDGIIDGHPGNTEAEWASQGEQNPWIQLDWQQAQSVNKVTIYDRPNLDDHAQGGTLSFSDGSSVTVTGVPNDGSVKEVTFSARSVTWVRFQVSGGIGPNVGLSEIQVFASGSGANIAPSSDVTVSSSFGNSGGDDYAVNVGSNAWMKKYADPRLQFSRHTVYNLTRPDKSVMLLAPLSQSAGGYAICGDVFQNTSDADYQLILKAIQDAKAELDRITRFSMPNFIPEKQYFFQMKRMGIIPQNTPEDQPLDPYVTDQKYWESLWWKPELGPVTGVIRPRHR
jgi:hypothetical protein